jgi:THO complex subunit 4
VLCTSLIILQIEIVVGAAQADKVIPLPAKSLAERATQPKAQPKSAASNKHAAKGAKGAAAKGAAAAGKKGGRGARNAPRAKKTAEELDSEMADYFGGSSAPAGDNSAAAAAAAPAAAPATGDAAMEDEIM